MNATLSVYLKGYFENMWLSQIEYLRKNSNTSATKCLIFIKNILEKTEFFHNYFFICFCFLMLDFRSPLASFLKLMNIIFSAVHFPVLAEKV